jgi:flagellar basal-body rod modification protein FlgD
MSIDYSLSAPADVELRILGANGNTVRRLVSRSSRAAGLNQATWDQKNDAGIAMPAGAYIVEIRAQSADGRQNVRAAQPILVTR